MCVCVWGGGGGGRVLPPTTPFPQSFSCLRICGAVRFCGLWRWRRGQWQQSDRCLPRTVPVRCKAGDSFTSGAQISGVKLQLRGSPWELLSTHAVRGWLAWEAARGLPGKALADSSPQPDTESWTWGSRPLVWLVWAWLVWIVSAWSAGAHHEAPGS